MLNKRFVYYDNMSLLTDLYELTMAQVYFEKGLNKTAVFNFFIRPTNKRNYFLFTGLDLLIDYLLNIKFTEEDLEFLIDIYFEKINPTSPFRGEVLSYSA